MNLGKLLSYVAIAFIASLLCVSKSFAIGAGVLPYKVEGGITYFLVGYNGHRQAVSDFGGGFEPSKDRDIISTAAREFNEETMFMFSAGTLPINQLVQTYNNKHLSIPYHRAIKQVIQNNSIHTLRRSGAGFDYTIFIVPVTAMPLQPTPHNLYTQREQLEQQTHQAVHLGAEPSDFVWLRKRDLYRALNGTPPRIPVVVPAPTSRNPYRTFTLAGPFAGVLRHAIAETGHMGLQAVMP